MRLDRHRGATAPAPPAPVPAAGPAEPGCDDLDAELRELLLAEYAQPVLIVLPGAAFLIRPHGARAPAVGRRAGARRQGWRIPRRRTPAGRNAHRAKIAGR